MSEGLEILEVLGGAALTCVGLTAAQTCAAIRAGVKRFSPIAAALFEDEDTQIGARVHADPRLRASEGEWLRNLAARALRECELDEDTALIWQIPEAHRGHELAADDDEAALARLAALLERPLSDRSRVLRSGAAGVVEGLGFAHELLAAGVVERCVIGGADSLLRPFDLDRLARDRRLIGGNQAQGLVPGEGAAFVIVGRAANGPEPSPRARVLGLGLGYERATVLAGQRSVGEAFASAFESALQQSGIAEAQIDFVAGNFNGERYDAWESAHANARCYRTRRERLPTMWPAASTGELGVAGGALALLAAADAIAQGYAVGPTASVQVRSEADLRGLALISAAPEAA